MHEDSPPDWLLPPLLKSFFRKLDSEYSIGQVIADKERGILRVVRKKNIIASRGCPGWRVYFEVYLRESADSDAHMRIGHEEKTFWFDGRLG